MAAGEEAGIVGLARALARQPLAVICAVLLAFVVWAGRLVTARLLTHFDRVEAVLEQHRDAVDATARAIERMSVENTSGREAAASRILTEVARCCPPTRAR